MCNFFSYFLPCLVSQTLVFSQNSNFLCLHCFSLGDSELLQMGACATLQMHLELSY